MFLVQKPDEIRNLNLSPFRLYLFVNKWNNKPRRRESLQRLADEFSTKYFKIELIDFDADSQKQSIINGDDIDIHLYEYFTSAHMVARLFPKDKFDYTFLPDTVDQLPDSPWFWARLNRTIGGVLGVLVNAANETIRESLPDGYCIPDGMKLEDYFDSLAETSRKELFEFLQRRFGYASPEKSRENLSSFLNYKFEEDYGEEDRIFMLPGDIDYGRTKPGFKIVVDKGKNKFNANDVTGTLDISIVTDNGESILLDFPTKSCKMTYLLVLLTHKYSFGLPQELYDKDFRRKVVYSVWKILYKTITHYVEETQKYGLRRDCNFINNQTFAKDDRLSDSQRYWISVYTDTLADGNLTLRPRRIKLPADLIEIYDSSLRYSCHDIPSIDMYKSGYIQDDLRKHITPLKE